MSNREGLDRPTAHAVYTTAEMVEVDRVFRLCYGLVTGRMAVIEKRARENVLAASLLGAYKMIGGKPEFTTTSQRVFFLEVLDRYLRHYHEGMSHA